MLESVITYIPTKKRHILPLSSQLIWLLMFLLFSQNSYSQDFIEAAQFYGIENGLSHRDVHCVHQDQEGFIWLGTQAGLNRFDGKLFDWFLADPKAGYSTEVNNILEDVNGLLWLIDIRGGHEKVDQISVFDPQSEKGQLLEDHFQAELPFSTDQITAFASNNKKELVFLTNDNRLIRYNGQWHIHPISLDPTALVYYIHCTQDGQYWIVTEKENAFYINQLDNQYNLINSFEHKGAHSIYIFNHQQAASGIDYCVSGVQPGFYSINSDGVQKKLDDPALSNNSSRFEKMIYFSEFKESQDYYWLYSEKHKFGLINKHNNEYSSLVEQWPHLETANHIFIDQQKRIWVATQFGVYLFSNQKSNFKKILSDQKTRGYSNVFSCRKITADSSGQLWLRVETPPSVWKISPDDYKAFNVSEQKEGFVQLPVLQHNEYSIITNASKEIAFFDKNHFYEISPKDHSYKKTYSGLVKQTIWLLHQDKYGRYLFYCSNNDQFGEITADKAVLIPSSYKALEGAEAYQVIEPTQSDTAFIVSDKGLFLLDINTKKTVGHYWHKGKGRYYFPFDKLYHIHVDKDGSWWMASNAGLIHAVFDSKTQKIDILKHYTRVNGLPSNTLYAIYEDAYNNLWMSSDYGIAQFNKTTGFFNAYTVADGLSHNEFNRLSHYQAEDGQIYFGGLNGLTTFHPRDFVHNNSSYHPPLVISHFEQFDGQNNQLLNKIESIRTSKQIEIYPNDRFFRLQFALLSYEEVDKIRYAYKIEGIDSDWNYQKENTLRFSRLPYGQHSLKIKGQAANGQWSEQELAIQLLVYKPFYLRTWFVLLAAFVFIGGIVLYFRRRTLKLQEQKERLEQEVRKRTATIQQQADELKSLERLKSRFFANVSHELRTPLTLLLGPINTLLKNTSIGQENRSLLGFAQRNAQQLLKLINEILDLSKLESGKLELKNNELALYEFVKNIVNQLSIPSENKVSNIALNYQLPPNLVIITDKDKLEKIIQNFLFNALRFTPPDGEICLHLKQTEGLLEVQVSDTGQGIHADDLPFIFNRYYQSKKTELIEQGGTGIGLSLCLELSNLLGGKVWAESELGKGSRFFFSFPLVAAQTAVVEQKSIEYPTQKELLNIQTTEAISKPKTTTNKTKKQRILLVEDNHELREYIKILLSDYELITAENGKKGLEALANNKHIDLIITDLMMPVMDGLAFLQHLKSNDQWRHLAVIVLTAKNNMHTKLNTLRIGVDDYLMKPFNEDELKLRIRNLLKNHKERLSLFAAEQNDHEQAAPRTAILGEIDALWLKKVEEIFSKKLDERQFKIEDAAQVLNLSSRQFSRRLKQLTGLNPSLYLQEMRLQTARSALMNGSYSSVKETCYAVGYNDPKYFSNLFLKHFGVRPSKLIK